MTNPLWLKTFLALIEHRNFTKTALLLGMTQPGVTQHIKNLENEYEITLFSRTKKEIQLTPAGEKLAHLASQILSDLDKIKDQINSDDPHRGRCHLASPGSFGIKMYSFLLELQVQYPKLVIQYEYRPNTVVMQDVLRDKIDLGFITHFPDTDTELDYLQIDSEVLCLITPPSRNKITFEKLLQLGLIAHPDVEHHLSRLFKINFPSEFHNINQFEIRGAINQITRIPDPVARGLGFTVLPELAVHAYHDQHSIQIIPLEQNIVDPIVAIWKKGRVLPVRYQMLLSTYKNRHPTFSR